MIRVDLGCGLMKQPGFVGADRFPLPGVDVVLDLDQPLPFTTSSVDLVVACHSLEHVQDLAATMREVYRVCKPGAQLCILAPYSHQGINHANPYHKQNFNEHTPRFWTASTQAGVDPAEYVHPHALYWGLSESDHSHPNIDLRCVRMEFFYFPSYRELSLVVQRAARKQYLDVCDQILYHLVVAKAPLSEADMQQIAGNMEYCDPPQIAERRSKDRVVVLEHQLHGAQARLKQAQEQLSQLRSAFQVQQDEQNHKIDSLLKDLEAREREAAQLRPLLSERSADLAQAQASLAASNERAAQLALEVDRMANRRIVRALARFARSKQLPQIAPVFQQLLDDSYIFSDVRGFQVQPSVNLQRVDYVDYPLVLKRPDLKAVLLALILDVPHHDGRIGLEIVSADKGIVAQATIGLTGLTNEGPVRLDFQQLRETDRARYRLRVFARDTSLPVRLFEWQRYRLGGLGPLERRAFCGFIFA